MSWSNMTMSAEETAAINFLGDDKIFVLGAQFMACLFDSLFCGVLLCQLTHWTPNAKKDSRIVQVLVVFGATAALSTTIYTWANYLMAFVYDFGMYERFTSFNLLGIYPILDGLTVVPVQIFFAERSVRINGNSMICAIVNGLLIAATFAAAVGVTAVTRGQDIIEPTDAIKVIAVLWPTICTTAHVFITTSIVTGLFKTRTTGDGSNKIINRVVAVSLESQLPATIFAVAAMTAIASNPSGPLVPFIIIVHPKVFMVGCLAMVNLRHNWRLTGKIPSSFNSAGSMSRPGLMSTSTSAQSHGVPTTPPLGPGLVRGFSGPSEDYKFDPESGCGLDGMNIKIKRPGEL